MPRDEAANAVTRNEGRPLTSFRPTAFVSILFLPLAFPTIVRADEYSGFVSLHQAPGCCEVATARFLYDPCTGTESPDLFGQAIADCGYQVVQGFWDGGTFECGICVFFNNVSSALPPQASCAIDVSTDLSFQTAQTFSWVASWPDPCGGTYDVVRGPLRGPSEGAGSVDLGEVQCLADDSSTSQIDSPDDPLVGQGYFYLVRARGINYGTSAYGFSSAGNPEIASQGDCLP